MPKNEGMKIKGSFRLKILDPDGSVAGDSGWHTNQIVNEGVQDYLCKLLMNSSGSKQITHIALGEGTEPGAAATSLQSELDHGVADRVAITKAVNSSTQARMTGTFASSISFVTTTVTLKNIGLFNTATRTTGTLFCGNTYATSTCASNQAVNVTLTNWGHLLVTVGSKLREFGKHLIETIPSRASHWLEGVETMHAAPIGVKI